MIPAAAHAIAPIAIRRRTKVAAGLLACFFGAFGAHWWYLGRRRAWLVSAVAVACLGLSLLYPVWYDSPVFFLLFIPMVDGFIEGVVLCLYPDEKFDRLYNSDLPPSAKTGWGPVLVALLSTLMGAVLSMFAIAMVVMHVYIAMGWLDGLVI